MNWGSVSEFLSMGGYALYVWGSFGACVVVMVLEPVLLGRRRHAVLDHLRRRVRAEKLDRETV